jgi:excinuclease ABC subunit C
VTFRFFFPVQPAVSARSRVSPATELREQVRSAARNLPGTYRMVGEAGEIVYVGKSKRVRARLLSYFRAREGDKAWRIVSEARSLSWEYEPSEFAALLRELELIKRHRPRFNVRHKRDGRYSFLKLAFGAAPKLYVVRTVADDAAAYFGPFRGGRRIEEAVRELNDVLGLRSCALSTPIVFADQADLFSVDRTPGCYRQAVGRCVAPCAALCTEADYLHRVALARAFLEGNADEPLRWLQGGMEEAAGSWNFEYAARLRDRAHRLQQLRDDFARMRATLDRLSFLYTVPGHDGEDRIYLIRRATVRAWVAVPNSSAERRRLRALVQRHYGDPEPASALVAKAQVDEILLLARWFRRYPEELERAVLPEVAAERAAHRSRPGSRAALPLDGRVLDFPG